MAQRETQRELPGVDTPGFVGRAAEAARLAATLGGPPAVVLVEGEAGIGKSRLVREVLGRHSWRALVAACPPFREALTLGPIVDALRRTDVSGLDLSPLTGTLRPLFPEWAARLPAAPEPLADAGAARHRLMRALAEILDGFGTDVLVVEDVHWADEATLDFLLFLAARGDRRQSVVLTYRPEDVDDGSLLRRLSSRHPRISLRALDVRGTADLVSSMLGGERVSQTFAEFLHRHTDGIPFALEECVRLLRDRADLVRQGGEWIRRTLADIAVPPTIRDAVSERVDRLDPGARAVLRACAVLSDPADEATVAAVCAAVDVGAALDAAVRSGLLVEDDRGRVAFRHALAAKAVYEQLAGRDRRELHRRAGEALETSVPAPVAALAHHFREAGETPRWCAYAEQVADLALASGDHQTAVGFLHELLTTPGLPAGAVARLAQKMPIFAFTGYLGRADLVATLRAVLDSEVLEPLAGAEIRSQLGRMLMHAGEYAAGAAELERAIPDLAGNPAAVARAMSVLGRPAGAAWPAETHRAWLDRAGEVAASVVTTDMLMFQVDRATALLEMGDESGWAVAAELRDEGVDAVTRVRGRLNIGDAALRWGRYGQSRAKLTEAVELGERHGQLRLRDMALVTLVHLDWFTGRWGGLADRVAGLAGLDEEPLIRLDRILVTGMLGAATGAGADPEESLRLVLDEATRRGIVDLPIEPAAALARRYLAQGRAADALAVTDEPVRVVHRKRIWLWATEIAQVRVDALAAADRLAEARAFVTDLTDGLGDTDIPALRAAAHGCRAALAEAGGQHRDAAREWRRAADAWEVLPRPYDALLARERQARCLLAAGEPGIEVLHEVVRGLTALGAVTDADRVREVLRGHGAPVVWRGGRRGYGDELSPRELEVVRLVLHGLTNPEIAQVLCRSPKTVAAQLNSAMRKHGVTSRTALAVSATRAGIVPAESVL